MVVPRPLARSLEVKKTVTDIEIYIRLCVDRLPMPRLDVLSDDILII